MIDIDLNKLELDSKDRVALQTLLDSQDPKISDDVEQMWYLLNKVWEEMGCDNKSLIGTKSGRITRIRCGYSMGFSHNTTS